MNQTRRSRRAAAPASLAVVAVGLALGLGLGSASAHDDPATGGTTEGTATPTPAATPALAGSSRTWPTAADTGANPSAVTGRLAPNNGGWYFDSATNDTIQNVELDGGIYFQGTGTLTLRNVILRPDWTKVYATVIAANNGSLVLDHVTIAGVNIGQGNDTKGFVGSGAGSNLDVGFSDISGICQNNVGSGTFTIHDNYIHNIGTGNGDTCHATPFEDQFGGAQPRIIRHNTLDEAPGQSVGPGASDGIFLQPLYGSVTPITIDNNAIHLWDYGIEVNTNGGYGMSGPIVTNNCFVAPGGQPVSDPNNTITTWSGNTRCSLNYVDSGIPVGRSGAGAAFSATGSGHSGSGGPSAPGGPSASGGNVTPKPSGTSGARRPQRSGAGTKHKSKQRCRARGKSKHRAVRVCPAARRGRHRPSGSR